MSNNRVAIVPESVIHAANMLGGIVTGNELTDMDYQLLTHLRSWVLMFDERINNLPPIADTAAKSAEFLRLPDTDQRVAIAAFFAFLNCRPTREVVAALNQWTEAQLRLAASDLRFHRNTIAHVRAVMAWLDQWSDEDEVNE